MARAQQGERVRRMGVLMGGDQNDPNQKTYVSAFTQGLAGLGWTDGRNVRMDLRWGGRDINPMRALAQELVGLQPDIVVTGSTPTTVAVQRETRTDGDQEPHPRCRSVGRECPDVPPVGHDSKMTRVPLVPPLGKIPLRGSNVRRVRQVFGRKPPAGV
jgi:hypothetical protein